MQKKAMVHLVLMRRFYPLFLVFLFIQCAHFGTQRNPQTDELVIVATTDFHSALDQAEGMASVIRSLQGRYGDRMIYLNGGDMFQGSMEGNMSQGRAVIDYFNLLPLSASAVGNHEMDFGDPVTRLNGSRFPWLSANFVKDPAIRCDPGPGCNALGQKTVFEPRTVVTRDGRRVGIIGITTPETANLTRRDSLKGTRFLEIQRLVRAEAGFLRKQDRCDWVILLIHDGVYLGPDGHLRKDKGLYPLFSSFLEARMDAVVAGHTHLRVQKTISGVPLIEAGRSGEVVGVVHLEGLDRSHRQVRFDPWIPVPPSAQEDDVTTLLKPYRDQVVGLKERIIGSATSAFLPSYQKENALGNLLADAVLDAGKKEGGADFSILNAGGFRGGLPAGPIRYVDLFKAFPFDNSLAILDLTGAEVRGILEIALSGELGMPAVSGLTIKRLNAPPGVPGACDRDLNRDGKKQTWERNLLVEIRDNQGRLLDDKKRYRLVTISFLAQGGDYFDFALQNVPATRIQIFEPLLVRDLVAGYLQVHPGLNPPDYFDSAQPRIELVSVDKTR